MTYEKYFLTEDETVALNRACSRQPFSRQLTVPWGEMRAKKSPHLPPIFKRHQVVSFSSRHSSRASYVGWPHYMLYEAPDEILLLAAKLSAHTGKDINYLSVVLYEDGNDYMSHHQHREDKTYDAAVYIVSTGDIRPFELREVATGRTRSLLAEPGSLITMSSEENDTHTHAVPKCKARTPRISINCKSVGPRVYDCHAGKKYPADAIYVGCKSQRGGKVIREGTIFGNGTNPLESHDGALDIAALREYAKSKANDPAFRVHLESLRGKDLLCWCNQATEADQCHARVWLQLANS